MASTDWILAQAGDVVTDANVNNAAVPNQQLLHDTKAHRFSILGGSGNNGHSYYKYIRQTYTQLQDLSVRMAMSMAIKNTQKHSIGIGLRLSDVVAPGNNNFAGKFAEDGYHLILEDDINQYKLVLNRVSGGAITNLFSAAKVGTLNTFKWFQFRLDFLLQSNGSAILQVFESLPAINPVNTPVWSQISPDIKESAIFIPAFSGVGFGVQGFDGGSTYDTYCDWVEIFRK